MNTKRIATAAFVLAIAPATGLAQHDPHWSYDGTEGPANWGSLAPSYAACAKGKRQSPVDIPSASSLSPDTLRVAYRSGSVGFLHNGHTVQLNVPEGSSVELNGARYSLDQIHFHTPSEHTIDGRHARMEIHFVHRDAGARLAVVGVLVSDGAENPELQRVLPYIPRSAGEDSSVEGVEFDPGGLVPADRQYWGYEGSLTTPPCSEGVTWIVLQTPIELSLKQIATLAETIHRNARPVQPLGARTIGKGEPDKRD